MVGIKMTDTLKFRAFCKEDNTYREVLAININKGFVILDMGWADKAETERWDALFRFEDIILEQYTGLKDRNGVKIFEGDVVQHSEFKNRVGYIIKNNKNASFQIKGVTSSSMTHLREYEVIGNIHENSDMLKGDK